MIGTKLGLIVTTCMSAFASAVLCIIALATGDIKYAYIATAWLVGGVFWLLVAVCLPSERKIKE